MALTPSTPSALVQAALSRSEVAGKALYDYTLTNNAFLIPDVDLKLTAAAAALAAIGYGGIPTPTGTFRNAASKTVQQGAVFTAVKQVMSTTVHTSFATANSIKIVDSNWSSDASRDLLSGGTNIVSASLEYPIGTTPQRFLFGGQVTGSNPDGSDLESDELIVPVNFAPGVPFKIHRYITNTAGIFLPVGLTTAEGDACRFAASGVVDVTGQVGGYAGASTDTTHYSPPAAILMRHTGPSVGGVGDSRFAGVNDTATDAVKYPKGQIGRAMRPLYPYIQFGCPGEQPGHVSQANTPRRIAFIAKYCTHVVVEHAINGFTTDAAMRVAGARLWNMFKDLGLKVYHTTTPPRTGGAYVQPDGSDQTEAAEADQLVLWNTYLRTVPAPLSGVIDLAPVVTLVGNPKKWKAPGYTTDGLHESTLANIAIKDANVITSTTFV